MTSSSSNKAWITLATNDSYSLGALVLAHSLKAVKTVHKLAILITPGVTSSMKQKIEAVFDEVKVVDVLDSKDQTHLALMSRPELGVTFTKLHCWTFTNYEKCVFLDADTLVLQNCDELFDREEFSAAPDPGWPDCFNSGVFVYKPSQDTFGQLLEFARTKGSFDGGDQGLLNMFFKDWSHTDISKHLSFTYNVVWSSTYSYLPALKEFGQNMKIIHFIASSKPWLQSFNTETRLVTATSGGSGLQALLQLWWDLFCRHVHPELSTDMGGLAGQFARVPLGEKTTDQKAVEDFLRRQSWEHGNMDYLGKDSFSNIWAKINETLGGTPEVKIESDVVKTASPPEVVHTEEPKPLKSALKKTSTTVPPVESELIGSSEPPVKQLEKLDLSKDSSSQVIKPDTPTVISPTPPTTPATQTQESAKPEAVESVKTAQTPAQAVEPVQAAPTPAQAVESVKTASTPTPAVEPVKTASAPVQAVEPAKQIPKPVEAVEPVEIATTPAPAVEPVKTTPTPVEAVEPAKQIPKPVEAVEPVEIATTPAPVVEPVETTPTPVQAVEPVKQTPKPVETVEPVKTAQTPAQAVAPLKETPKPEKVAESPKETPKPAEVVEPLKETPKPVDSESTESVKITEPVKETSTPDKSTKESLSSGKDEQCLPKSDESVKQVTKPTGKAQKSQSSTEASGSLESDDPPVAPKRTNKGSPNVPKK